MSQTKLTDFDCKTLSNVSFLIQKRIKRIQQGFPNTNLVNDETINRSNQELDRLLNFNTQVLTAFSFVKSQEKVTEN